MEPFVAMSIAGSDSGGGAGIQADLRTFAAHHVHGTTAITAITAQNTTGVSAVCPLEPEMVAAQVEMITSDLRVRAVKTGMLARPQTIRKVAQLAEAGLLPNLVVDPVLVSSTGHALMEDGGVDAYRFALLPHAVITTPNLREAAVLTDRRVDEIRDLDDMREVAESILRYGPQYVLLKGGHFLRDGVTSEQAPDVLVSRSSFDVFDAKRVVTSNDHGTGCSLAAAITSRLAHGSDVPEAVRLSKAFVHAALTSAARWHLGAGHGPIDHLGWNQ